MKGSVLSRNLALLTFSGLLIAVSAGAQSNSGKPAKDEKLFGSKTQIPFALKGDIYYLPEGTGKLPDFSKLKPVGRIYVTELNVPARKFDQGFPGVTDRFEWFAIDYNGNFLIDQAGKYKFRVTSDDGTRLYIDGKQVIDNDGVHAPTSKEASIDLARGLHQIRLSYFQGPRWYVALVMEVAREGGDYRTFKTGDYAPAEVSDTNGELKIEMGDAILFDFNKYNLKPDAAAVLTEINSSILAQHPGARIAVGGHTDDRGSEAYNLRLSRDRAQSVADWLTAHGIDKARLDVKGYGKSSPKVPNTSDQNRARNRRVEISVLPEGK